MDNNSSSNDDDEPKVCTVFASSATTGSKTVFDTIAFAMPKKEPPQSPPSSSSNIFEDDTARHRHEDPLFFPAATVASTSGLFSDNTTTTQSPQEHPLVPKEEALSYDHGMMHSIILPPSSEEAITSPPPSYQEGEAVVDIFAEAAATATDDQFSLDNSKSITEGMNNLILQESNSQVGQGDEQGEQLYHDDQGLTLEEQQEHNIFTTATATEVEEDVESPILTANKLFANTPEVPFPIGGQFTQSSSSDNNSDPFAFFNQLSTASTTQPTQILPQQATATFLPGPFSPQTDEAPAQQPPFLITPSSSSMPPIRQKSLSPPPPAVTVTGIVAPSTYNSPTFTPLDAMYDAWIPKEETKKILFSISSAVRAGTHFPDKSHLTTPGIIYEDDLIDKVGVNMSRIFGEAEASKRRILTADNVNQDDNGLRELIKLGCYRSAINLTKRLLTLYGQGSGKVGQFSKHNPHTLQLWFTRISLLIRIREFTIAESEIDAFKEFDNPDLYFEYYSDTFGKDRKGSMVPFNFRVLAAEILQYSKKHNETIDRLTRILHTVQQIIQNLEDGLTEEGIAGYSEECKAQSLGVWRKREIRVFYSLANASLFAKDYYNAFKYLTILCEKDKEKEPQLKSAIGRFFLQLGDLSTANNYFQAAADLRSGDSEAEQAENLVDSAMITVAHGSYPEAYALLKQALPIQPDNFMITNNMSVCLLYMGKVKESLALMEATVKNNTPELLQENVLLNLSTIYELENTDGHKKNALLRQISEYKGDGINLASLKMPNLI